MNKNRTKRKRKQKEERLMKEDELTRLTDNQPRRIMNQSRTGARPGDNV